MIESLLALVKPRVIFAFMFYSAYLFLALSAREIPETLSTIVNMLFGFYFGVSSKQGDTQ